MVGLNDGLTIAQLLTGMLSHKRNKKWYRCESDCRSRGPSLILARSHTFLEIDHEIISTVILLASAESFKKGCCQLQMKDKYVQLCTKYWLTACSSLPRKKCG